MPRYFVPSSGRLRCYLKPPGTGVPQGWRVLLDSDVMQMQNYLARGPWAPSGDQEGFRTAHWLQGT